MPILNAPVILVQSPMATGNHVHENSSLLELSLCTAMASGAQVMVQFWPTNGATTINSASYSINGGASTAIPAAQLMSIPGGGKSTSIPVSGNVRDQNYIDITCTDNAAMAQSKTARIFYYLKA
ncbi:MAG: hypothetical protein FJ271_18880 [Planctomycetes bacterium]|nr:hypothetical protein [Planctomycetota bacterium]